MQNQHGKTIQALIFVLVGTAGLIILASGGVAWGAPSLQGTIPGGPGTPVPPTPLTGLGGCCLPGVVFTSLRDGNPEIYVMKSDGSALLRLTNHPAVDGIPIGRRMTAASRLCLTVTGMQKSTRSTTTAAG